MFDTLERHDTHLGVPRPVMALTNHYGAGHTNPPHVHWRAQLLFAEVGVMRVTSPHGTWVVPPNRAIWIPAETPHAVQFTNRTVTRSIYIEPDVTSLGPQCVTVNVTELLRALILEFAKVDPLYRRDSPEERLVRLLLDHMRPYNMAPVIVPRSADARLRKIMDHLIVEPNDNRTLEEWGQVVGASEKTLSRAFLKETNMGFRKWRQQARLLKALELLADGEPVTNVAFSVGYESVSAFINVFKEACGKLPSEYY